MGRCAQEVRYLQAKARKLFVVGTGTDIGKTYICGLLVRRLKEVGKNAAYYKAAMSGNRRAEDGSLIPGDAIFVKEMSGIAQPIEQMCPYVYERAVSPHLASRIEGNPVQLETVTNQYHDLLKRYEYVTIEGSGGILCPICFDEEQIWLADVIRACEAECILVADAGLGTINSVGLTAFYMKEHVLRLKGIIFNHFDPENIMHRDNIRMCEHLTGLKTIACVSDGDITMNLTIEALESLYSPSFREPEEETQK